MPIRKPKVKQPKTEHPSENKIQEAYFNWATLNERRMDGLDLAHHIPNGSYKSPAARGLFKRIGQKAGVLDVNIPVPQGRYCGLYIEFKTKIGRLSDVQKWWIERLTAVGHKVVVCRSWWEGANETLQYFGKPREYTEDGERIRR